MPYHSSIFTKTLIFTKTFPTIVQVTFQNVRGPLKESVLDDVPDCTPAKTASEIGTILHALFGLMLLLVIGGLLVPIYGDIRERIESQNALRNARAARIVAAALQFVRIERGPIRATLEDPAPASSEVIKTTAELALEPKASS